MPKLETQYEIEAKEYISHLDPQAQKLAVKAIDDCLALNRSWRWINTALNKKGYSNWNRWHFGLFFSNNFNASVNETIKREDEAEMNDLDDFFTVLEDRQQFTFPQMTVIPETEDEAAEETRNDLFFYHAPRGNNNPYREDYSPHLFKYYDQIICDGALELNIPVIQYGLDNNDIPQEYVSIYKEALINYAGDANE